MEKYKLILRHIALNDLQEIYEHIAHNLNETEVAEKIHGSIVEAISSLSELPLRHQVIDVEPYRTVGYRMLHIRSYVIFYIVDQEKSAVHIVRILYNRREWQNIL